MFNNFGACAKIVRTLQKQKGIGFMSIVDRVTKKLPDYYPTMYMDGYEPHEIMNAFRKKMRADLEEQYNPESPTNIHITTEIKKK